MAKYCGYGGQSDPLDHMNSWTFKKALDLLTTNTQDLFKDSKWIDNQVLYSKKYNIRMPHLIGGPENTMNDYQRRIERFKEYKKDTETNFLFIREITREINYNLYKVEVLSENIKENYSDDIFSHEFFEKLLPKKSKILLLTTNNQEKYHPLTESERTKISNNFYLCENVSPPGWLSFGQCISRVRKQYTDFLKYIDQNFNDFDIKKAESIISSVK